MALATRGARTHCSCRNRCWCWNLALEEKGLLGLGTTSRSVHILFTYSSSRPVAGPSTPDSPTPRTPTNASTAQYILNDTSLAAAILPNNDRHLYFQDSIGRIRYVIRTASTDQ